MGLIVLEFYFHFPPLLHNSELGSCPKYANVMLSLQPEEEVEISSDSLSFWPLSKTCTESEISFKNLLKCKLIPFRLQMTSKSLHCFLMSNNFIL